MATHSGSTPFPAKRFWLSCCCSGTKHVALRLCFLTFALTFSLTSHAEWVEWIADADAQIRHNDNVNRSAFSDDVEEDTSINSRISFGRVNQINSTLRLSLSADLAAEFYDQFELLNNRSGGITVSLRNKLGLGLEVPWLKATARVFYLDVRDDLRSGINTELDLLAGHRFSERLDAALGIRYQTRDGKKGPSASPGLEGEAFDHERFEIYVSSSFLLTERLLTAFGLSYFDGEIDSACTGLNVGTVLMDADINGITNDNIFGGCVYRLKATAYSATLDGSYALDRHSSINLGLQVQEGESGDLKYDNTIFHLTYKYSY